MNAEFWYRLNHKKAHVEGFPHKVIARTWGSSVILDANTRLHYISGEPSLQVHTERTEEYILLAGMLVVYRGTLYKNDLERTVAHLKSMILKPGDKIIIAPGTVHVPVNISSGESSVLIEISHGIYDEGDINRIYDQNGRDAPLKESWMALGYPSGLSIKDLVPLVRLKLMERGDKDWLYYEQNGAKVVTKPWGNGNIGGVEGVGEVWLNYREGENVGDEEKPYVFKKLYAKKGTKMSFQHHEKKKEINFLVKGKVEAWYENLKGEIEKRVVEEGGIWEITPPTRHRTIALEDSIIIECSTPEVDDVVRHEDDAGRGDGRINEEHLPK